MEQAISKLGSLTARASLTDGTKLARPVAVRLGWTLFWTDLKNVEKEELSPLPEDLYTWRKLPSRKRHQLPLVRGSVELCDEAGASNYNGIKLKYGNGRSNLELDFGDQELVFQSWREALFLMLTPWANLLDGDGLVNEEKYRILLRGIARLSPGASDEAKKAEKVKQLLHEGIEKITKNIQREQKFVAFVESIMKAFEVSEGPVKDILGKVPLVGAGFQVLAFGMSCTANIIALRANEKLEAEIRQSMAWIAGLTITEMLRAVERGEEGKEHLRALSEIMCGLESVMRELDLYIVKSPFKKLLLHDKSILPVMLTNLNKLKEELRSVQAAEGAAEVCKRQEVIRNVVSDIQNSMEDVHRKLDQIHENQEHMKEQLEDIKQTQEEMKEQLVEIQKYREVQEISVGSRSVTQEVEKWVQDFSTVPGVQGFVDLEAVPSVKMLVSAVLNESGGNAVGVIGAHGIGGVGKTIACTVVANDLRVRKKFNDGIFWVCLGMDSTAEEVIKKVAKVLENSGGFIVAKKVEAIGSNRMQDAISAAHSWLSNRKILVVVDNVWPRKPGESPVSWVSLLSRLVGAGSCLLFSTRFASIASFFKVKKVEFGVLKDASSAVSIFHKHLELEEDDELCNFHLRDRIVQRCKGLPLALSNAARLLQWSDFQWEEVMNDLDEDLVTAQSDADAGEHPGLESIIALTLAKLDKAEFTGRLKTMMNRVSRTYAWSTMYYMLAVLPKSSTSMPIGMLALLWKLETREAKQAIDVYCNLGLGSVIGREVLKIHDLQWQCCSYRCSDETVFHERLVRRCPFLFKAPTEFGTVEDEDIINFLISDVDNAACQDYLIDNAVRHVTMSHNKSHSLLRRLLTDYRWIRKKAEWRSLLSIVADYALVLDTVMEVNKDDPSVDSRLEEAGILSSSEELEGYKVIRDTLRRVPDEASPRSARCKMELIACCVHRVRGGTRRLDSGLAAQLIGRLVFKYGVITSEFAISDDISQKNLVIAELLSSVYKYALGPWLCPVTNIFGDTESECERKVPVGGGDVYDVALSTDERFVYSGSEDGVVRKHNLSTGECIGELRGHKKSVSSIAVASGGTGAPTDVLFSGARDGTIRVWSTQSMECVDTLETREFIWITSLAASQDGKCVISGCSESTVRVWSRKEDGSWKSHELIGHTGWVRCVALSGDCQEIASGSDDKTVRLWRRAGSRSARETGKFQYTQSLLADRRIAQVSFASGEENTEVVLGLEERGAILVWKKDACKALRVIGIEKLPGSMTTLCGPEANKVIAGCFDGIRIWRIDTGELLSVSSGDHATRESAAITQDGQQVVCCSSSGVIEIWPVGAPSTDRKTLLNAKRYREREVLTDIAASEDRSRAVTVYNRRKIQIWTAESGSPVHMVENALDTIWHVRISADGSKFVTVDRNGQIVCWDAVLGTRKGTYESGLLYYPSIALSRNGRFLALRKHSTLKVWNMEAQELAIESRSYRCLTWSAFDHLTNLVKEQGLEKEAHPVEKCGSDPVPGFSVSSPGCALFVAGMKPPGTVGTEKSGNECSCAASVVFDRDLSGCEALMLPYFRGLDSRAGADKRGLGMIAIGKSSISYPEGFDMLVIVE